MTKRIFVVDDERIIADSLATILNSSGYETSAFYDAESALLACELGNPDCLITDVVMPGMSGIDLAVEIKDRFPACRVLLFSGQAATADLLATVRGRGHDFNVLPKPVHPKDLLARLEMDTGDSGRDNS
jgi:DNA-binding NtrC family response regulator